MPSEAAILQQPPERAAARKLSPTLFVGIGGTGKEVLLRLRRRILQADWNGRRINRLSEFPVAAFVYFDLDMAPATESDRSMADDLLAEAISFDQSETMQQKLDAEEVVRNLARHRYIKEWWPAADIKSIDVSKGAGQVRALSRMSFFLRASEFRDHCRRRSQTLLQNISNQDALRRLGLETSDQLRVVVVASTAGGTGSGAFIDIGLMLRSEQDPRPAEVDLYLLLPGGFTGKNAERVQANTYAALMELEHTMRPLSEPRFTDRWSDRDAPLVSKPFDDVYLLDNRNIVSENTGNVGDLYNMIADLLFEDFGSSEFADRKRSVAVNQEQWKLNLYYPDLPDAVGGSVLGYSRAYSSIGQATLDTFGQVNMAIDEARAIRGMIDAYFGIGDENAPTNVPSTDERNDFLRDHLYLGATAFNRFPEDVANPTIGEFVLVDELLAREDTLPIDRALELRIDADVNQILQNHPKPGDWRDRLESYSKELRQEIEGTAGGARGGPPIPREINERGRRILERWRQAGGLQTQLYTRIDNKERGGLDYTIQLIQMIHDRIATDSHSVLTALQQAQREYDRLASSTLTDRFNRELDNLSAAARMGIFNPRAAMCRIYAESARNYLKFFMVWRVRSAACAEAQDTLREMLAYLGEVRAPNAAGVEIGTGLIAEFLNGRNDVRAARAAIDFEIKALRESVMRRDGMYQVIDREKVRPELRFDRLQLQTWADDAFRGYNGSRELFPALHEDGGRLIVLNGLRASAKAHLARVITAVPSLIEVLSAMHIDERHRMFQEMMRRTMPWINANLLSMKNQFNPDQFKLFVAMRNVAEFQRLFGTELRSCLPAIVSASADAINFVEAPVAGRMVALCELSGIPLDVITSMRASWRQSYNLLSQAGQPLPLHGHKDSARFPHPVVPSDDELNQLQDRMRLLLRGIVFGLVTRMSDLPDGRDPNHLDQYVIEMGRGNRINVGSERVLRSTPFVPAHREQLERLVRDFDTKLQPIQMLAASALFRYTALRAYAKKPIKNRSGQDDHKAGLMHVIASGLEDHYRALFDRRASGSGIVAPDKMVDRMSARIAQWTREIEGSLADADPVEVNINQDDVLNGALPKRRIDPEAFDAERLRREYLLADPQPPPFPASPLNSDGPAFRVLLRNGEDSRDSGLLQWPALRQLAAEGKLTADTEVWNDTLTEWTPASKVAGLRSLFAPVSSPSMPSS